MSKEAMKLARENFATAKELCDKHSKLDRRIVYGNALITHFDAVCQALAEQPAQQQEREARIAQLEAELMRMQGRELKLQFALAEQPAQQQEPVYWQWRRKDQPWSLEYTFNSEVQVTTKDSERRALYTSPQPTQQQSAERGEPKAYIHRQGNHWEVSERMLLDDEKARGWTEEPLYTSPPASKPWVGLTPDDIRGLCANTIPSTWDISLCRLVEKFLKEKNNA